MSNIKIGPRHQVTIPHKVFKKLKLVAGDILILNVSGEAIVLTPSKVIPRDQAWFWTKEWQEGEAEADKDIAEGRVSKPFDNAEDLINHLKNQDDGNKNTKS